MWNEVPKLWEQEEEEEDRKLPYFLFPKPDYAAYVLTH